MPLTLDTARTIVDAALAEGRQRNLKPLTVAVVDAGGALVACAREDGSSSGRPDVALGKALGALALNMDSADIAKMADERPQFFASLIQSLPGPMIAAAGGLLLRDSNELVGAVGISGDLSDEDAACADAGKDAAGLS